MTILESSAAMTSSGGSRETTRGGANQRLTGGALQGATDRGSPAGRVRELALAAADAALHADWDGGTSERKARNEVSAVCDLARAAGMPIEQLLIVLKDAWYQSPENRRTDPVTQATLARIVTISIHEYYRSRERS